MKAQLSFLRGISIICLSFFISFINCSTDIEFQTLEIEPLTDVLTLELTFGADENVLNEKFLLAIPYGIEVNYQNDILVLDENWVKVYNSAGKGETTFGGPGQGPGEFSSRVLRIWISPNGYLTIFGGSTGFTAHYFRPDYTFIKRINYGHNPPYEELMNSYNFYPSRPEIVFNIGEAERVYAIDSRYIDDRITTDRRKIFLFYETADTLITLANYMQSKIVPGSVAQFEFLGDLKVDLLPDNRIVYLHTFHDSKISETEAYYTITIISLNNMKKSFITHRYIPVEIEWEPYQYTDEEKEKYPVDYKRYKEEIKRNYEYFAERKFRASLQSILTDNKYIFAFTYHKNDKNETLADIFDGDAGEYINSAYFPIVPRVIKNSDAYMIAKNEEGFYVIEKYKINPAVYGK